VNQDLWDLQALSDQADPEALLDRWAEPEPPDLLGLEEIRDLRDQLVNVDLSENPDQRDHPVHSDHLDH
jgi:hypothetical protein